MEVVAEQTDQAKEVLIPKGLRENLEFRVLFHQNCEKKPMARAAAIALFEKEITTFFDLCLWTYDPRKSPSDRPFILWDYQEPYVQALNLNISKGISSLTEKSRDMGVTWMILGVFLYRWLFFDENFLVGSRKEDLVDKIGDIDTLFERIRYMISTMPQWIVDCCGFDKKNMAYMKIFKENKASIVGESMNKDFSRQGRYNAILLDEFAFVENAELIWTACGDSAPCKIVVSTPHGSMNTFARLRKSGQVSVETLHWKSHPEKDNEWYRQQKENRPEKDIAQELDINYIISAGKPFYGGFTRALHVRKIECSKELELVLGWDYGYHHPCCVISQIAVNSVWGILDCVFGENLIIQEFAPQVVEFLNRYYKDIPIIQYGDYAGEQQSDKSKKSSAQIVHEITGVKVISIPSNTPLTNYDGRKTIIEGRLKTLIDTVPSLIVNDNPRTQIIVEAFEGGWHYPEANKYGFVGDKPVKEGYYEHPMNCLEYIAINRFKPFKSNFKKTRQKKGRV